MDNNEYNKEKSDTQKFWLTLIRDIFGVINPEDYIDFEKSVAIEHVKFIDAYIPSTGIIIEQKSTGKNLDEAFKQAKNYYDWLPFSQRGRYILTCDFNEIHVHDMEAPTKQPTIVSVSEASRDNLAFLITPGQTLPIEIAISVKAGELIQKLYKALLASLNEAVKESNYRTKEEYHERYNKGLEYINIFCVRLVFLLYAEDSGLFPKSQFHDYIAPRAIMASEAFLNLFDVLNTEVHKRDIYQDEALKEFPFVNGGLFNKKVKIPQLDENTKDIIIHDMAEEFNWSGISPTIFGAIFEATLNSETRKIQGMHYTSVNNIHKVIDPLFLDELTNTLEALLSEPVSYERTQKLLAFQNKLASLKFLDPACGSGNFLTESFISLRILENQIIAAIPDENKPPVKVSIHQFHGIESHDFAVNVAKTALWISDHQMWKATQEIYNTHDNPLPLKDYDGIEEGDALNSDLLITGWNIKHEDMLYIMGNPPFVGYSQQTPSQKDEVKKTFKNGKVDYVSCWFMLAADYVQDKNTKAAFVATNSITQGEQPAYVFNVIRERLHIKIDFAHQPFVWKNELPDPKKMAHVHIVIIGFSSNPPELRKLYTPEGLKLVKNINFYLTDGPDDDIAESTDKPISPNVPEMLLGNLPRDGGHLIIELEDYDEFIRREPKAAKYIKLYIGANEFINNLQRYCLWLVDASPQEIKDMPLVHARVKEVKEFRQASTREATRKLANTSWLFAEIRQPNSNYIIVPRTSSEGRKYIPMGFMTPDVIASNAVSIIPDATLYHFGILTSRVHMAWMRRVCGRLKSDYRYSSDMVYNTFAWPSPTKKQRAKIEMTAQAILDARENIHGSSFAAMYDDSLMPSELRKAHEENDRAVCRAYGWDEDISENEIVNELFKLYHELTEK